MKRKIEEIPTWCLIVLSILICVCMGYCIYALFGDVFVEVFHLLQSGNQDEITAYLQSQSTVSGWIVLGLIAAMQVVTIVFPCLVIQVAGALIYGWWKAFFICWIGYVVGNVIAFVVARIFKKSIQKLFDKKTSDNWLMQKINHGNQAFVVALACMIPGVPNGLIPYIASTTTISLKHFIMAVACSCWVQILLNCIAGHFLAQGEYVFMILAFIIEILLSFLLAKNRDKLLIGC